MVKTVLYAEKLYDDDKVEREVFGSGVRVVWRNVTNLSQLEARDCAEVDGLMVLRHAVTAEHLAKFPRLACVVRMGVGYDKIDRQAAAQRKVMVCNVPDYGTTEVADHALALALSLRRGIALHLEAQRRPQPAPWRYLQRSAAAAQRRADLRHRGPGPHRHGGGAAGQGVPVPRRRLRPLHAERHRARRRRRTRGLARGADGADRHAVDPCAADARRHAA